MKSCGVASSLVLIATQAAAQTTITIPAPVCTATVTCQPMQITLPGPPVGGTTVTALPLGWRVNFPPVNGAVNYVVTDPHQHWLSSSAGSPHLQSQPPIFVQGISGAGSVSASLQIYTQTASGFVTSSPVLASAKSTGAVAVTDPYWIYHNGQYNWSCDFSQFGGDPNVLLPQYGGAGGPPNPNDVDIAWFDTSVPALSGPETIRINNPVTGNFSPCILGTTVSLSGFAYLTVGIRPEYAPANYTVLLEGQNDAVVSNLVTLGKYASFTANAWSRVNVPVKDLNITAGVYKVIIQQVTGQYGVWHVDDLGWVNTAR